MFFDVQSLPASGGMILGVLAYAGVSLFFTGPLVGERLIEKSGWAERCPQLLETALLQSVEPSVPLPTIDCNAVIGWMGPEGQDYCSLYGGLIDAYPLNQMIGEVDQQKRDIEQRRLQAAVSGAGNRCGCAVSVALEEYRSDFALYAGSLRLLKPRQVTMLQTGLEQSLAAPICTSKGY